MKVEKLVEDLTLLTCESEQAAVDVMETSVQSLHGVVGLPQVLSFLAL